MADAEAIARVHIASSEDSYAPLAEAWRARDVAESTARWEGWLGQALIDPQRCELVAEVGGRVVGFIGAGPARRDDVNAVVEVYVIHIHPANRANGLGSALWATACARIREAALRSLYVETLAELRCCSFYEARAGERVSSIPDTMHGGAVTRVVYLWRDGQSSALAKQRA
jgi:ribosomal protein S18 acetylase RimI-like enzyme